MILSETLFLDNYCENCESKEYMEHDSGFYVCVNCAVVSNMRHGLALEYKDLNTKGMKYKRKNIEEAEEDEIHDFNNFETNLNTLNNTCAGSDYNDSYSSRLTKGDVEQKPLAEVLLENQKIFVKLFKGIFYFQFMKIVEDGFSGSVSGSGSVSVGENEGKKFPAEILREITYHEFYEKIKNRNFSFFSEAMSSDNNCEDFFSFKNNNNEQGQENLTLHIQEYTVY